jgi:hypothetical protein
VRQHRGDLGHDGPAGDQRGAEITAQRARQEGEILLPQRPVEAEPQMDRRDRVRRRLVAQDDQGRIAGDDADDHEDERQHGQQRRHRRKQAPDEEADHARNPRITAAASVR